MKLYNDFILFVVAGGTAAFVNFISRIFLNNLFSFEVSIVIAYVFGMITAYFLTRFFVFKSNVNVASSSLKFVIVNIFAVVQTYFISVYLYIFLCDFSFLPFQKEISHFVGISFPVFTSYIGHKYWSFKR